MLWTLRPDSTHRYLVLVYVNSLSKHNTYINIIIDDMYKIRFTNECCIHEITDSVSPFSYFRQYFSTVLVPLSSPFLSCPCWRESYLEFTRGQTPSSEGCASVSVWNFSICSEHGCMFRSCLKMRCLVWIDHVSRVSWWCQTIYSQ